MRKAQQEYRIVEDNDGHSYVIKADELQVFNHWVTAMEGKRHFPRGFVPAQIGDPHTVVFTGWREET